MEKIHKKVIIAFLILVGIKIILSLFISSPSIFADEYIYLKNAQSFQNGEGFHTHGDYQVSYPPLYPIIISSAYFTQNSEFIYLFIKILNSIIISLIIFPAYFLSKEFLNEKDAFMTSILISLLPQNFGLQYYIMSENLYYPLFLFYIYLLYKSLQTDEKKYFILSGIVLGFALLTRAISYMLIPITIAIFLLGKKFNKEKIKNILITLVIGVLIYLPYRLSKTAIIPGYEIALEKHLPTITSYESFILWFIFYTGLVILSTGIIGSMSIFSNIKKIKDNYPLIARVFYTTIILSILLVTYYASTTGIKSGSILPFLEGRPVGRYIDYILPLVIILAVVSIKKITSEIKPQHFITTLAILVASIPVIFFSLFPLNNISTSWIGAIKFVLNDLSQTYTIIIFLMIYLIITYIAYKIIKNKKEWTINLLLIFFILINILNFTLISHNSGIWGNSEQMDLGKWINENIEDKSTFLIDKEFCIGANLKNTEEALGPSPGCKWTKVGIWINNKIIVDGLSSNKEYNYIITKQKLDKELIKNIGTTYLYKN